MLTKLSRFGFVIVVLNLLVFSSGCITTRASIEREQKEAQMERNVETLQKGSADLQVRLEESQEQSRDLYGRLEVLENQLRLSSEDAVKKKEERVLKEQEEKKEFSLLLETVSSLQEKVTSLEKELDGVKKAQARKKSSSRKKAAKSKKLGPYNQAEQDYSKKRWKESALNYQKYREKNPKGRQYARATYRMGMAFMRLDLKDDAVVFFEEVVSKFSKSDYARYSRSQLKKLKK